MKSSILNKIPILVYTVRSEYVNIICINKLERYQIMKAVILAGGKGTRLGNLTKKTPKLMLKIGDKTILEHQIDLLKRYRIFEIIICTGFLSEVIEEFIINNSIANVSIRCSVESKPLGTAGSLIELETTLSEDFLVLYGDIMLDIHIYRLLDFHLKKKSIATLVSHPNDHPNDSDLIELNKDNKIVNFLNKPHQNDLIYNNIVNAGIYVLSSKVFDYIERGKKQDFAKDVFPNMLKNNEIIYSYNTPEYIKDMGTKDRLNEVRNDYLSGKVSQFNLENKRPAIFLDRDGVINKEVQPFCNYNNFNLMPKVPEAIKEINHTEYLSIVTTNQPTVAKGLCSINEIENTHKKMETLLGKNGAKLDAIYFCPHHPEKGYPGENKKYKINCSCRKPEIKMIVDAKKKFNVDLKRSFLVGDRTVDIQTAKNANITSIGTRCGYGCKDKKYNIEPNYWADDLYSAVNIIKSLKKYNSFNESILSKIRNDNQIDTCIIVIGGISRSGKTIFTTNLNSFLRLNHLKVKIISMDDWIISLENRQKSQTVLDRFQITKFENDLKKIINGKTIKLKKYHSLNRSTGKNVSSYHIKKYDVIVICGACALNSTYLNSIANLKIYIEITYKVYENRFYNFYKWKGLNNTEIYKLYKDRLYNEVKIIEKFKNNSDLIIRGDYYDNK